MIKKLFTLLLACGFFMINSGVLAAEQLPKIGLSAKNLTSIQTQESEKSKKKKKYRYKTVLKYYTPYEVEITNKNTVPVLLNAETDIDFIREDKGVLKAQSRREIYKRTRKRDMGRYYGFALPGAAIAGGITGITLFIGAPLGAMIAVGTYEPTNKAVRANVDISQEMYNTGDLPIRFEPGKTYPVRFYLPKNENITAIRINNLTLDKNTKTYELVINIPQSQGGNLWKNF